MFINIIKYYIERLYMRVFYYNKNHYCSCKLFFCIVLEFHLELQYAMSPE